MRFPILRRFLGIEARRPKPRPREKKYRPSLEALEGRLLPAVNILNSFPGISFSDTAGLIPPDADLAAGPNHVVETVNASIAMYNKTTGVRQSLKTLQAFFKRPAGTFIFDPVVTYDDLAGRFVVAALEKTNKSSFVDLAVSDSSNPTGRKAFSELQSIDITQLVIQCTPSCQLVPGYWGDYPKLGYNADAIVLSFNMFTFSTSTFDHVQLLSINKTSVLDKDPKTLTMFRVNPPNPAPKGHFTMAAATMHGSVTGDPMYFVEEGQFACSSQPCVVPKAIRVVKMTNILSNNPMFVNTDIAVAGYTAPPRAPQPIVGNTGCTDLDIGFGDSRILNAEWRNNRLVASQNIGLPNDPAAHARWYEFDTTVNLPVHPLPTLTQQGTIMPGNDSNGNPLSTYMPAIAIANNGDLGMSYMQSSATTFVSMYVTGQKFGALPGTTQPGALVQPAGVQPLQGNCPFRVGDYSGISLDPLEDTFWAANEYAAANLPKKVDKWGTLIANFSLA